MGPRVKDLQKHSPGAAVHKHAGKGSSMAPLPDRNTLSRLQKPASQSLNDYAKATPMGNPSAGDAPAMPDGLGSGFGGGIGM